MCENNSIFMVGALNFESKTLSGCEVKVKVLH